MTLGATAGQNRGITELKNAWDAAWAAKDAAAYARNYTVNGELVNPLGGLLAGREEIHTQHEFLFSGPFAGSTSISEMRRTVFLGAGTRMLDLDVELTGFAALPPGLIETEPGVLCTRMKLIVVERQSGWKILAQQITAVAPTPLRSDRRGRRRPDPQHLEFRGSEARSPSRPSRRRED